MHESSSFDSSINRDILTIPQVNAISQQKLDTAGDRVEFLSRTFGSPAESTLITALEKGYFQFPGVTLRTVKHNRHRLRTPESAAGHLDQARQNSKSHTKQPLHQDNSDVPYSDNVPIMTYIYEEKNHMDATGAFPITSFKGNNYLMIFYSEGANYILGIPFQRRNQDAIIDTYQKALTFFTNKGLTPTFQRMDNEVSQKFKDYCKTKNITIELVPPHQHRRNKAERAIRTYKNHFGATLAGVDPNFPMGAWDELLEHIEITLNLLRSSPRNPRQSAWEMIHGPYDFNRHPLAPPGTRVTIHEKPAKRSSWAQHGVKGYYVGPALEHYRCYKVWAEASNRSRITDTLAWHPKGYAWNTLSGAEIVSEAASTLSKAIIQLASSPHIPPDQRQPLLNTNDSIKANLTFIQQLLYPTLSPENSTLPSLPNLIPAQHSEAPPIELDKEQQIIEASEQRVHISQHDLSDKSEHQESRLTNSDTSPTGILHAEAVVRPCIPHKAIPAQKCAKRRISVNKRRYNSLHRQFINQVRLQQSHPHQINTAVDMDETGKRLTFGSAISGPEREQWLQAHAEEIVRLITSKTIVPIHWLQLPKGRKAAYYNPQVRKKMKQGKLTFRVRGTIGGDQVDYQGETAAYTASLPTIKILLNSVVSDNAKWMTADISDFYLGTPLPESEYMQINLRHVDQSVLDTYKLLDYATNGMLLVRVDKGIYGLPQAGRLAQERLIAHLSNHGYYQTRTAGLFRHKQNSIAFSLVVDDFGIKYHNKIDAEHLLATLRELYTITEDWATEQKYVGITIKHDVTNNIMTLSMPGYVDKALIRFNATHLKGCNSPIVYIPPAYGKESQIIPESSDTAPFTLSKEEKKYIQEVVGVFLFYARAVDCTILTAVNKILTLDAQSYQDYLIAIDRLLNYVKRFPNAQQTIRASDMTLRIQSDASYLSESRGRSRAGGLMYFGQNSDGSINGAIDHFSAIIPTVVSSAAEAEYAALFLNGKEGTCARNTLQDLGHKQPTTVIICDNTTATGIAHNTIKQKRSKAIDMRYHWIQDQIKQKKFNVIWREGISNLADFLTKAHPVAHFLKTRRIFVSDPPDIPIRECARSRRIATRIQRANEELRQKQ
jgi:hypothetical protein